MDLDYWPIHIWIRTQKKKSDPDPGKKPGSETLALCSSWDVCSSLDSTPGCCRSNSSSNPGILPNIVHKVKISGQSILSLTLEQKSNILTILLFRRSGPCDRITGWNDYMSCKSKYHSQIYEKQCTSRNLSGTSSSPPRVPSGIM